MLALSDGGRSHGKSNQRCVVGHDEGRALLLFAYALGRGVGSLKEVMEMAKVFIALDEKELLQLERICVDEDEKEALEFVLKCVAPKAHKKPPCFGTQIMRTQT